MQKTSCCAAVKIIEILLISRFYQLSYLRRRRKKKKKYRELDVISIITIHSFHWFHERELFDWGRGGISKFQRMALDGRRLDAIRSGRYSKRMQ